MLPLYVEFPSQKASDDKIISGSRQNPRFILMWSFIPTLNTNTLLYWLKKGDPLLFAAFEEKRSPGLDKN